MAMFRSLIEVVYCLFKCTKPFCLLLSSHCFISTTTQGPMEISHCVLYLSNFLTLKTGHHNNFLLVRCLTSQHQGIPEGERCVLCCYQEKGKSPDVGNLHLGSLSTVGIRIRIAQFCLLGTGRETGIIGCLSKGHQVLICKELLT